MFKAASTNWMENIIHLSGLTEKEKKRLEQRYKRYNKSHLLLDIRLAVHYLSVQFSQPNMQARQIAPFISKSQLRSIAEDPSSLRMITTRHPFFRLEIILHLTSWLMMSPTFRLLSAFRDKFERCTTSWDCTKRKDWQVLTLNVNWWDNTKCNYSWRG